MSRQLKAVIVAMALASLIVGCNPAPPAPPTPPPSGILKPTLEGEGTLNLTAIRVLETLNPHTYTAVLTSDFMALTVGWLYRFVPSDDGMGYGLIPELASAEPRMVDSEGLVWQIDIAEGAKFANGTSMTAEDFVYSWKMLLDPKLVNHRVTQFVGSGLHVVNHIEYFRGEAQWEDVGIKQIDPMTIELTLRLPATLFQVKNGLANSTFSPVYTDLYEGGMNADRTSTDYGTTPDKLVSSGPFMASSWEGDAGYACVKNPHYIHADDIWLAGISFRVVEEAGTTMQLFRAGEAHYVALGAADYEGFKEDPRVWSVPLVPAFRIALNVDSTDKPILQNVKFRQALSYAVDREQQATIVNGIPGNYLISTRYIVGLEDGLRFRDTPEGQAILSPNYGYDPEKARKLLNEALSEEGIANVNLTLLYHEGRETVKAGSELLQKSLEDVFEGKVRISLQAVPSNQLSELLRSYPVNPNAFEMGWTATVSNVFMAHAPLLEYHGPQTRRKGPYENREFDAIVDQIIATPVDQVQLRAQLIAEAEAILLRDVPAIGVVQHVEHGLVSSDVTLPVERFIDGGVGFGWAWARLNR